MCTNQHRFHCCFTECAIIPGRLHLELARRIIWAASCLSHLPALPPLPSALLHHLLLPSPISLLHTHMDTQLFKCTHTHTSPHGSLTGLGMDFFYLMWFGLQLQRQPWARAGSQLCHSLTHTHIYTLHPRSPTALVAVHWSLSLLLCLSPSPVLPLTHSLSLSHRPTFTPSLPYLPSHFFFFMTAHISKPPGFLWEPHVQYTEIVQPSGTSAAWLEKQREPGGGDRQKGEVVEATLLPTATPPNCSRRRKQRVRDHRGAKQYLLSNQV